MAIFSIHTLIDPIGLQTSIVYPQTDQYIELANKRLIQTNESFNQQTKISPLEWVKATALYYAQKPRRPNDITIDLSAYSVGASLKLYRLIINHRIIPYSKVVFEFPELVPLWKEGEWSSNTH